MEISHEKVIWVLRDGRRRESLALRPSRHTRVDVRFDPQGRPAEVKLTDPSTARTLTADPSNFFIKVDAAFNGNSFFWDDMFVSLETAWHQPALSEATLDFWYLVQGRHAGGVIPREVRKRNGLSYNPPEHIRLGVVTPNGAYTNPYLAGWVEEELYALEAARARQGAAPTRHPKRWKPYLRWQRTHRAVVGENGAFWQDDRGSGMDNSPRGGGEAHPGKKRPLLAWVDLLAQAGRDGKRRSRAFTTSWANGKEATKAAAELPKRLEDAPQSPALERTARFLYFDRVPDTRGKLALDVATPTVAGFWPLWSGSASPAHLVDKLIALQMTSDRFGGEFPFPSLSPAHPLYSDEGHYWLEAAAGRRTRRDDGAASVSRTVGGARSRCDLAAKVIGRNERLLARLREKARARDGGGISWRSSTFPTESSK